MKSKPPPPARASSGKAAKTKAKAPVKTSQVKPLAKPASRKAAAQAKPPAKAPTPKLAMNKPALEKSRQFAVGANSGAKVKGKPAAPTATAKPKAAASTIVLPADYRPSDAEPFMNPLQRLYFRQKLLSWKEEILRQTHETLQSMHEDVLQHADLADRATSETDRALELRERDRQRKLIAKIDAALARIEDGTYGFCEETGEPIGLRRLDARPIATLSLEAQERHERRERIHRGD